MGEIVVTEFLSLDGVMEDPGGAEGGPNGGWAFRSDRGPDGDTFKLDELMASDAQLLGRVTYEGFAKAWPAMGGDPFGDKMNDMPKFVVSTTLETAEWNNSTILGSIDDVAALKEQFAGDILVVGSATLAQSLLAHDLVDRLHLMVYPVLLGSGKQLFADDAQPKTFVLTGARTSADVAILTYRRTDG